MPEPRDRDLTRQGPGKEFRHGLSKGARRKEAEMRLESMGPDDLGAARRVHGGVWFCWDEEVTTRF